MAVSCKEIFPSILFTCFVTKIVTSKKTVSFAELLTRVLLCKFHLFMLPCFGTRINIFTIATQAEQSFDMFPEVRYVTKLETLI